MSKLHGKRVKRALVWVEKEEEGDFIGSESWRREVNLVLGWNVRKGELYLFVHFFENVKNMWKMQKKMRIIFICSFFFKCKKYVKDAKKRGELSLFAHFLYLKLPPVITIFTLLAFKNDFIIKISVEWV